MKYIILFIIEIFEHSFSALKSLGHGLAEDAGHNFPWVPNFFRVIYHAFRNDNEAAWMILLITLSIIIVYLYIRTKKKTKF